METVTKYKLLKDLPDVKAGEIISKYTFNDYGQKVFFIKGHTFNEEDMKRNSDWFTPYIFTTEDKVDIYKGNYVCIVLQSDNIKEVFNYKSDKQDEHCLYFSSKEKAEQYLESLKPKFKVGDIVTVDLWTYDITGKINEIKNNRLLVNTTWIDNVDVRLANESEVIKYYEQQGWVKGVKFKMNGQIYTVVKICYDSYFNDFCINTEEPNQMSYCSLTCGNCELIKEPDYLKSRNEIKTIDGYYFNSDSKINYSDGLNLQSFDFYKKLFAERKQAQSALAFAQLSQLHKAMIDEYNRVNNCNWNPDYFNEEKKWYVELVNDYSTIKGTKTFSLRINYLITQFKQLVFPTKELVEFSLKHHLELWRQYYQLD